MASEQKRLFLTLSLSALVLFGYQYFFAPKTQFNQQSFDNSKVESRPVADATSAAASQVQTTSESTPASVESSSVQAFTVSNDVAKVLVTSDLVVKSFEPLSEQRDIFTDVVGAKKPFQFFIIQNGALTSLMFNLTQPSSDMISGTDSRFGINFTGKIDKQGRFLWNLSSKTPYQYFTRMESSKQEGEGRQIRQYVTLLKETERTNVDGEEKYDGPLQWMAVDYHYHLFANVFDGKPMSSIQIDGGNLETKLIESTTQLSGFSFYGLKGYDQLQKVGSNLHLAVDFGVFGIIAVPILKGLQFFYKYVPNFGLAIILITLFIRTLLFPLQYKSFKSMKKMQQLQPELAKLKEKFSDDPQKMQRATMELFKKNGANPMGGCLPLLLQMPVFFAFYQVLFNSVELLNAPFILWIKDLSAKDPYYVLPVLMGIAMFFQTKLNPSTTADPMQKKMMMFMPLIFTFFMKDLPAGLNLYIFVSTIFGITQQLFVYKTVD